MLWGLWFSDGRTNSGRFDHVPNCESLDCLILWCASRAVAAADWLDVTAALLVATVGCALLDHVGRLWWVILSLGDGRPIGLKLESAMLISEDAKRNCGCLSKRLWASGKLPRLRLVFR